MPSERLLSMTPAPADKYEALLRAVRTLSAGGTADDLLRVLSTELRQLLEFDELALYVEGSLLGASPWYVIGGREDVGLEPSIPSPVVDVLARRASREQRPLVAPEDAAHPTTLDESAAAHGFATACAVPLATRTRRIGSMVLSSSERGLYSGDELRYVTVVADHVALAIDYYSTRASQDTRDTADRLRLILDINNTIVANLELQDLLHAVSASLRRALQCDAAAITVADTQAGCLRFHAVDFPESVGVAQPGQVMPIEGTLLGDVFKTGKPALHSPANGMGRDGVAGPEGVRFGCAVPLFSRNKALGVLSVGRRDAPPFTERDLELLVQLSTQVAIALDNSMAWGQINDLKNQLAREKVYLEDEIRSEMQFREIVGKTKALREILQQVEVVAPTDSTVLIYGETGTGKEAIARAIHDLSARKGKAFVKLNCAALPTGLMETELFGHEKGAFTGAISQRIGRFELAKGGSVFLDEIGEIPLEVQPKLLRVLQEREFERLGGSKTFRTDARLIAATNRDLEAMVREQKFRPDLYYRLNVFPIRVPPLRERADDVPLLVRHFVHEFGRRMGKTIETIPSETMDALVRYHWPGNIRELQNVVERAVILTPGSVLNVAVGELASRSTQAPASSSGGRKDMQSVLDETERQHIIQALEETNWVIAGPNGAAARLGMNRSTLHARMQKLGVQITRSGPTQ